MKAWLAHPLDDDMLYERETARKLARISANLLRQCEVEQLVQPHVRSGGRTGYSAADIRELARIRRLRDDLGLPLDAIEVVLHMRRQLLDLQAELARMERQMAWREQELLVEMAALRRRLAEDAGWE